jgi:general secretion pathway protein A
MDRIWASMDGTGGLPRRTSAEDFALPSRGEAIVALRPALDAQAGPILVTGEAGVGKTWLCRRLVADLPPPWRSVLVDVPPAIDPATLYNLIGHRLGLAASQGAGADQARLALANFLREAMADGVHWALVLDEAHNASAAVLEEVRVLSNRLGQGDGLSALILVGQTDLACRLAVRPLSALAARLTARVHLRCLDVEEARTLLNCLVPELVWDDRTLERQHRDASGNPRRMLQAAATASSASTLPPPLRRLRQRPSAEPAPSLPRDPGRSRSASVPTATGDDGDTPVIGPYKPPLLVGDGMVEVGWEGRLEAESESASEPAPDPIVAPKSIAAASAATDAATAPKKTELESELESEGDAEARLQALETIDDHYTALQAWNEWARNRGRTPTAAAAGPAAVATGRAAVAENQVDAQETASQEPAGQPSIWVDGEHGFAPYGQLFSRLRQSRDINESS